jgi:preprotein translocase subunit SecF
VIFDRVNENTESISLVQKETYGGAVNLSLNQTFMRSVNTSLTTLLPISALLLLGGETLKDFAFALLVGVGFGTYSSLFVAAPVLVELKEREPRYRQLRQRAEQRRLSAGPAADLADRGGEPLARPAARPGGRPRSRRKAPPKRKRR